MPADVGAGVAGELFSVRPELLAGPAQHSKGHLDPCRHRRWEVLLTSETAACCCMIGM